MNGATVAGLVLMLVGGAVPASAELVVLRTGRSVSVQTLSVDGGKAVLTLRDGGQIICDARLVVRVEPDEVPWPGREGPLASAVPPVPSTEPFGHLIERLSRRHGVETALVLAVVAAESAFKPRARSPKGAMGLMQLMPDTARQYAVEDPYEPRFNLDAGIRHLRFLLDRYDTPVALAAYNAGEGAVRRYSGVPPYRETLEYVERVLRQLERYRHKTRTGAILGKVGRPAYAFPTS